MLLPQFTIRRLLALTALCGVFSLVVAQAMRGQAWAIAWATAVGWLLLAFLVFAAIFGLAWLLAGLFGVANRPSLPSRPAAVPGNVPQLMVTEEPE